MSSHIDFHHSRREEIYNVEFFFRFYFHFRVYNDEEQETWMVSLTLVLFRQFRKSAQYLAKKKKGKTVV